MTRIFGHYISFEMLCLWLIESALSFLVIYTLLAPAIGLDSGPFGLNPQAAAPALLLALAIGLTASALGLYRPEVCLETRRLLLNTALAGVLVFPAILAAVALAATAGLWPGDLMAHSWVWLSKILLAWVFCLMVTRVSFVVATRMNLFVRRILIVGSGSSAKRAGEALGSGHGAFFAIAGVTGGGEGTLAPERLARDRIWGLIVAAHAREAVSPEQLMGCKARGIRIFSESEFHEQHLRRVDLSSLPAHWLAFADGFSCSRFSNIVRRTGDVLTSLAFLVFTLPVMLVTALAIRLDSPGPVFYRQERVGLHGRTFMLCKFRSMRVDAEAGGVPAWAATRDPRVTRVGRFIRRTRIDELPQLLNVLQGEMGFIGPRPERPHFVEQLAEVVPGYRDRAYVKPGITGWAQVNFPYGASIEDARMKLSYDLYYVKHRSLFLDLLILLATVRVILLQEGSR